MNRTACLFRFSSFFLPLALGLVTWAACRGPSRDPKSDSPSPRPVTFSKDIAPIVFTNCAICHHPGGSAPFNLLTYSDVKKRARQIAVVTQSRYMPPWLPEPGYGEFVGERRLSRHQIQTIQRWVEEGALEGSPSDLPLPPQFTQGWELGEPDLVVEMPAPYSVPARGRDVFRNFVFPVRVQGTRYVRALEIHPGNKTLVHHANILIDRTGFSRRLDSKDPEVGFGGMEIEIESERFEPQSHFLFWKPGTPPDGGRKGMAWRVDPYTDLVLNMHMQPSGRREAVQPTLGLYFTEEPPIKHPMLLQLEDDGALDIPPGEKAFAATDTYQLPVDVQVLGIYPHAHYLGKEIQGWATLPDGEKKWLIYIRDWDFNWQAVYRYRRPIFLPKGARLSMRFTYDNSSDNAQNPNHPPRRVVAGNQSSDEMSHLWIQVLPQRRQDLRLLQETLMRHRLKKYPFDPVAHTNLGSMLQARGRIQEAIDQFHQALKIRPDDAATLNNLGAAFQATGRFREAVSQFRHALKLRPNYASALYNLGNSLLHLGQPDEAVPHFLEVLRLRPDDVAAHRHLGEALTQKGELGEAAGHFRRVLRHNPEDADTRNDLGNVLAQQGQLGQARRQYEKALRLDPDLYSAHANLARILAREGKLDQAVDHFEKSLLIKPEQADTHNNLGIALAQKGQFAQAASHFKQALLIDPENSQARNNLERARALLHRNDR
ncbi:MAG: tetratricopeptide repeat protein [Acidobacteriota bacterium]